MTDFKFTEKVAVDFAAEQARLSDGSAVRALREADGVPELLGAADLSQGERLPDVSLLRLFQAV